MKKILLLSRMLSRGSGEGDKEKTQNADTFNLFMIIVLAAATFAIGMFLTPISNMILDNSDVATLLAVAAALLSLIRVFPMIINGLFMSKDVEVLLTLPYSPLQLALSNCVNIVKTIGIYQVAATFPFALGCLIAETGDLVGLLIMDVLFVIFIPFFVAFFIIFIATLIMKALKTMANKEFQKILGVVFGAIALVALYWLVFSGNSGNNQQAEITSILDTINKFKSLAYIIPVAPFIHDLVIDSNIQNALWIVVIDGGITGLALFVLNKFYLSILKQVTNTFGSGKEVSQESISKSIKSTTVKKALVTKDLRLILRDSAYYLNGLLVPIIVGIFFLLIFYQLIGNFLAQAGLEMNETAILPMFSCGVSLGIIALSGTICMSGISACSLSREGHSYIFMKQMPIPYIDQLKAKRQVALLTCFPAACIILLAFCVFGIIQGVFEWYTLLIAFAILIPGAIFFCNTSIIIDLKKPNLFATNFNKITQPKTSISIVAIVAEVVALFLPILAMLLPILSAFIGIEYQVLQYLAYAILAIVPVVLIVLSFVSTKRLNVTGVRLMEQL